MTPKDVWMLSLATICGFIGGTVATRSQPVKAAAPDTIQASRFELVGQSGDPISVWGRDKEGRVVLAFQGQDRKPLAAIGLRSDSSPFLDMVGSDGVVRATLRLESGDKPLLGMSDRKWEGRVLLGFISNDTAAQSDDWGLLFRAPGSGTLASIGVVSDPAGTKSGALSIRNSKGRKWSAPR